MISTENTISTQETTVQAPAVENQQTPQVAAAPAVASPAAPAPVTTQSILDMLSGDLKEAKSLQNFKDVNELAKSYLNAQALIGKRLQDMSPEDLAHINNLKGIPNAPESYKLADEVDPKLGEWYKGVAHKAGLSQDQAKNVVDSYIELNRQMAAEKQIEQQNQANEWVENIRSEFGNAFDQRIELAKRAVDTFGGPELKALLNETGLGNNPTIVKLFSKIGKDMMSDALIKSDHEQAFGTTPDEAQVMINQKMLDKDFRDAYFSARHPAHAAAVAEMTRLHEMANAKKG